MVDLEQADQRRVASSGLGQDGGHAIETLELLGTRGVRDAAVAFDASALFANEERDDLKLGSVGWSNLFAGLRLSFHLAYLAGEDRDQSRVVYGVSTSACAGHMVSMSCER